MLVDRYGRYFGGRGWGIMRLILMLLAHPADGRCPRDGGDGEVRNECAPYRACSAGQESRAEARPTGGGVGVNPDLLHRAAVGHPARGAGL